MFADSAHYLTNIPHPTEPASSAPLVSNITAVRRHTNVLNYVKLNNLANNKFAEQHLL